MRLAAILLVLLMATGCRTFAAAPHAPDRNTVVHDRLLIHSDFPVDQDDRLLVELEELQARVHQRLDLPLANTPIDVYLFQEEEKYDQFMTGAFPEFPKRRAFFVESSGKLAVYAHWNPRVAEDLRHEVSHGYLHAVVPNIPLWLDEGLAEYFETAAGERGLNPTHAATLADAAQRANWRPDLARLEALPSTSDLTQLDYAESWAWVHFLLESGPETTAALHAYLAELQKSQRVESLSSRINHIHYRPADTLLEHLAALRNPQAAGPVANHLSPALR